MAIGLIIISIILFAVGMQFNSIFFNDGEYPPAVIRVIVFILAALLLIVSSNPFKIINSDERGLKFTLGAISSEELKPGLNVYIPIIQSIKTIPITPLTVEKVIPVGSEGAITKDNQTIGAQISVFYTYKQGEFAHMWKNYGRDRLNEIITASLFEDFKAQIGKYDIFSLPTAQEEIRKGVFDGLRLKLTQYPINIIDLKIMNYDWSDEFDKQIAATMKKAQKVKQKQQELLISEQEAQKNVKKAEAEKTSIVTIAEGKKIEAELLAQAKEAEGLGIKKYNEYIKATLDIELAVRQLEIEKIRAEKWDGKLVPTNNYGPIPFETGKIQGLIETKK